MNIANEYNIDVPKTLAKFYKMADSNEIFTYVNNLRNNIVTDGEPEWTQGYPLTLLVFFLSKL